MKSIVPLAMIVILSTGAPIVHIPDSNQKFVDKGIDYLQWSRDGQSLFYSKGKSKFFRYDIATGEKKTYDTPDRLDVFGVSPDETHIMFPIVQNDVYGICVMSLASKETNKHIPFPNSSLKHSSKDPEGTRRTSYELLKAIISIDWITKDTALLLIDRPKGYKDVYRLDLAQGKYTVVRQDVDDVSWTVDGSGFIYLVDKKQLYFHNLSGNTDKRIELEGITDLDRVGFLYASKHQVAMTYRESDYVDYIGKLLDLETMKSRPIILPKAEAIADISPSLDKCLTGSLAGPSADAGWKSNQIYITQLPDQTVKELRKLENP